MLLFWTAKAPVDPCQRWRWSCGPPSKWHASARPHDSLDGGVNLSVNRSSESETYFDPRALSVDTGARLAGAALATCICRRSRCKGVLVFCAQAAARTARAWAATLRVACASCATLLPGAGLLQVLRMEAAKLVVRLAPCVGVQLLCYAEHDSCTQLCGLLHL